MSGSSGPSSYVHAYPPDVLLPVEWYAHELQSSLFAADLRMPVYADALARRLGLPEGSVPSDARGVCYVPGVGDDVVADLWRDGGSPIHDRYSQEQLVALVTPPLCMFDNTHLLGARLCQGGGDDGPGRVDYLGRAPRNFLEQVKAVLAMSFSTFVTASAPPEVGAPAVIVGARLNMLTSGLRNLVLFVHTSKSQAAAYTKQTFLDVLSVHPYYTPPRAFSRGSSRGGCHRGGGRLRVRVIPRPLQYVNGFFGDLGRVIRVDVDKVNEAAYQRAFQGVQALLADPRSGAPRTCFRYLKFDRASQAVLIAVQQHGSPYDVSDVAHDKALAEACAGDAFRLGLQQALAPMRVRGVSVLVSSDQRR